MRCRALTRWLKAHPPRALSRNCRGAKIYGCITTAMNEIDDAPPPPDDSLSQLQGIISVLARNRRDDDSIVVPAQVIRVTKRLKLPPPTKTKEQPLRIASDIFEGRIIKSTTILPLAGTQSKGCHETADLTCEQRRRGFERRCK